MGDWRITWRSIIVPLLTQRKPEGDQPWWSTPYWAAPPPGGLILVA